MSPRQSARARHETHGAGFNNEDVLAEDDVENGDSVFGGTVEAIVDHCLGTAGELFVGLEEDDESSGLVGASVG